MTLRSLRRIARSRIGLRLLAFNVLVVFVPVLGILYLGVYETHLRQAQESGMAQQARILAAAIGDAPAGSALDPSRLARIFDALERRTETRLQVYGRDGKLIADSARVAGPPQREEAKYPPDSSGTRDKLLYRVGAHLVNAARAIRGTVRGWVMGSESGASSADNEPAIRGEIQAALAGRYGAATRSTPGQRSLTLFAAVPVRSEGAVVGAVVVSQSTYRILRALYDVRLRVFEIVLLSLVVAAALTAVAAATIVLPLDRLQTQATRLATRRGRGPDRFPGASRKDELGTLARALEELTRRTNDHIALLQAFSADVSHELKNPLASIRTAAEMMSSAENAAERARFLELMTRDVARLERLVSSLRDIAVVERQIAEDAAEPVDLADVLREVAESANRDARTRIDIRLDDAAGANVRASRDRLLQVFENLIANAVSFAPGGTPVDVQVSADRNGWLVTVEDRGPGIPDSHLERVFTRFFSYRPGERRGEHVGLGLAIARQIVESYGGTIAASNREGGGARFEVRLPAAGAISASKAPPARV